MPHFVKSYYITNHNNRHLFNENNSPYYGHYNSRHFNQLYINHTGIIKELHLLDNRFHVVTITKIQDIELIYNPHNIEISLTLDNNVRNIRLHPSISQLTCDHNCIITNFSEIKDTCTINYTL